jgi:hypothetical protein
MSPEAKVRDSGLWNKEYVFGEYDRKFLDVMEQYVDALVGRSVEDPLARSHVDARIAHKLK